MHAALDDIDQMLQGALRAGLAGEAAFHEALDRLPAPVYLTDLEGTVTYFNGACVDFAGRVPELGRDRWCVTWKLYTDDGVALPHEQCPMALAIQQRSPIRGVTAIAERPDGTRVPFLPFPTPLFDEDGELTGAVNLLLDLSDSRQAEYLRIQARRCRSLASSVSDRQTGDALSQMAAEYEALARKLEGRG